MKKTLLLFIILLTFVGCQEQAITKTTTTLEPINFEQTDINSDSSLDDFKGKPSVILFGGTYCPHCVKEVPIIEEEIFLTYKNSVNVWINVIDQKRFDVNYVPQGYNPKLSFNEISKTKCQYVPSWVLLDSEGNLIIKSCGSEKDVEDIKEELDILLKQ